MIINGMDFAPYKLEESYFCEDECDSFPGAECQGHGDSCSECDGEIYEGWVLLDGGTVYCDFCFEQIKNAKKRSFNEEFGYVMNSMKELEIDKVLWTLLNVKNVYTEKEGLYHELPM